LSKPGEKSRQKPHESESENKSFAVRERFLNVREKITERGEIEKLALPGAGKISNM